MNWQKNRAIVFLDPYGMSVEWATVETIGKTKAADLWILFPLGQAVNRLLTRNGPPEGSWATKLTKFFGTEDWKTAFYRPDLQSSLFSDEQTLRKEANFDSISKFFVQRLEKVFAKVAPNYRTLRNSRNVPIFLLYFAAANPKGAATAVRIANHILGG
jgi:three-Cys-motif partner protein